MGGRVPECVKTPWHWLAWKTMDEPIRRLTLGATLFIESYSLQPDELRHLDTVFANQIDRLLAVSEVAKLTVDELRQAQITEKKVVASMGVHLRDVDPVLALALGFRSRYERASDSHQSCRLGAAKCQDRREDKQN